MRKQKFYYFFFLAAALPLSGFLMIFISFSLAGWRVLVFLPIVELMMLLLCWWRSRRRKVVKNSFVSSLSPVPTMDVRWLLWEIESSAQRLEMPRRGKKDPKVNYSWWLLSTVQLQPTRRSWRGEQSSIDIFSSTDLHFLMMMGFLLLLLWIIFSLWIFESVFPLELHPNSSSSAWRRRHRRDVKISQSKRSILE